jgi:hypothetical protein
MQNAPNGSGDDATTELGDRELPRPAMDLKIYAGNIQDGVKPVELNDSDAKEVSQTQVGEFVDERCFDECDNNGQDDKKRNKTAHLGLGVF